MRNIGIIVAAFLLADAAPAQRLTWYERLLLLQAPQNVSGVVVDDAGRPVPGAHIDHSDVQAREQLFSDDHGRFQIRTRAPALIVRKLGFDGVLVRLGKAQPIRIVLRRATRRLPECAAHCRTLETPASAFCVPPIAGIEAGAQGSYEETFVRAFTLQHGLNPAEMLHGAGPHWSLGVPYTGDVWESTDYAEHTFLAKGSEMIDAHGIAPGGRRWRYLGRYGESVSYYEADPATAAAFDRALDGVCLADPR